MRNSLFHMAWLLSVCLVPAPAGANGLGENWSWQFQTSADRANNAAVLDLIARRQGGYYDGFSTTVNNTTNIGTQVNCNNYADALGNQASNGLTANAPNVDNTSGVAANGTGNVSENDGTGGGALDNSQSNSGSVNAGVDNSNSSSQSGPINGAPTDQVLNNTQDNSGNQNASISDSTACSLDESNVNGAVEANGVLN